MEHARRKKVAQHPAALRQHLLKECEQPGASVARVAQSHEPNPNMVHAWQRRQRMASTEQEVSPPAPAAQFIELRPGSTTASISWPSEAAAPHGAWLREGLR
jgi:transposase